MNLKESEIGKISQDDSDYPDLLKEIQNPPAEIYVLGKLPGDLDDRIKIAIVGTRKATEEGKLLAKQIAEKLSKQGIIIVSGLAMGIDTAAHEGALSGGSPTIAVLACGLDDIYPRQNENLAKRIIESGGAIISEYPAGTPAFPNQFLERNRIVSGLCIATIVIEAPYDSGALVTARLAAEQGREVFVFPGPVNHPNYKGSHKLIRDGARLAASIEDMIEDLNLEILNPKQIQNSKIQNIKDEKQLLILKIINETGGSLNIDKIIELTKLEPQMVNQSVAELTIGGFIKETERGYTI
jgi:DNA processing protein